MTSNANDIRDRIRRRMEAERQKMDAIDERKLQDYGERWDAIVNARLPIIDAAMEKVNGRMHGLLRRAWLRPLVIGLSLFLGIYGGSWGLLQWQSSRVQRLLETQETYRRGIAQEQRALDQLQAQTWGVWLHEEADATRYVVLPRRSTGAEREQIVTARDAVASPSG